MTALLAASFVLFGWLSPPAESTSAERMREMADVGFDVALPALDDLGRREDNLRRLDLAAPLGIRCILWDGRFKRLLDVEPDSPEGGTLIDSVVADYRAHPAFLAYYMGDEPAPPAEDSVSWLRLAKIHAALRLRDPAHPTWNNLRGRVVFPDRASFVDYLERYVTDTRPAVLSTDQYDFARAGDRDQFVENTAAVRAVASAAGLPFWGIIQLIYHFGLRPISPGELSWQVAMLLAYGASGIGYFTYWTPPPNPSLNWGDGIIRFDGRRGAWYDVVADLDRAARAAGETLARLRWVGTQHAGSVPAGGAPFTADGWVAGVGGRAALGSFVDSAGTPYVLVANSDSLAARTVTLTLRGATGASRLEGSTWTPSQPGAGTRVPVALDAGGFALLRLDGTFGDGRLAPRIRARPSPARNAVELALSRLAAGARLDLFDATGRRVWRRVLAAGDESLVWRGERDGGGAAPPGLYFVRVTDRRGTAGERIVWLGR